jgi:hypothetical protein
MELWEIHPSIGSLVVSVVAVGLLIAAGYLGGHIVYHGAMGVEPNLLSAELTHHHQSAGGEVHASLGDSHAR